MRRPTQVATGSGLRPALLRAGAVALALAALPVLPALAQDTLGPTLLVLSPTRNGVVTGTDKVKVQFWDPSGPAAANPLQWEVDGGGLSSAGVTVSPFYDCGANCNVYEFDLDVSALTDGSHTLTLRGEDSVGNADTLNWPFEVTNTSAGSGLLLRRSTGSQLCIDCHNLTTHSSQHTSTKYGNWAVECLSCHDPHRTTNVFLIRESLVTPNSGTLSVLFHLDDEAGDANPGSAAGNYSFLGARDPGATPENSPYDDGICEVCHTQTSHWRNDEGAPDHTGHDHNHNANRRCLSCHFHNAGFQGSGACLDCHGEAGQPGTTGPNNRRAVHDPNGNDDFDDAQNQSHHLGNGGTMGGSVTSFDCVVCHAEGRVNLGATAADDEVTTTSFHQNEVIDLKDVDDWDNATGTGTVYAYDKDDIAANAGAAANWNSGNQYWREWTSGVDESGGATLPGTAGLDPFCLSCHDTDGATDSPNRTDSECGGTADALNPFCDGLITNNYDQQDRTRVVDVESKVTHDGVDRDKYCSGGTEQGLPCGVDADCPGSTCVFDGIPDPPDGTYSRHAIRGQSASRYTQYQNLGQTNCGAGRDVTCMTIWEGGNTTGLATLFVQGLCVGGTDDGDPCTDVAGDGDCAGGGDCVAWGSDAQGPLWNDTSVMGCADCHTVDGAHGTGGNAHGAPSEYLLKDANDVDGVGEGTLAALDYVCHRCHVDTWYFDDGNAHTGRDQDWVDTTGLTGNLRVGISNQTETEGSIFGMACHNCHGGRADTSTIALAGFGTIHGTSQTFGIGEAGGSGTRNAYRFTNGSSLRWFDPDDDPANDTTDWIADAFECYTLGSRDSWGSCTQHDRGQDHNRDVLRPISY